MTDENFHSRNRSGKRPGDAFSEPETGRELGWRRRGCAGRAARRVAHLQHCFCAGSSVGDAHRGQCRRHRRHHHVAAAESGRSTGRVVAQGPVGIRAYFQRRRPPNRVQTSQPRSAQGCGPRCRSRQRQDRRPCGSGYPGARRQLTYRAGADATRPPAAKLADVATHGEHSL